MATSTSQAKPIGSGTSAAMESSMMDSSSNGSTSSPSSSSCASSSSMTVSTYHTSADIHMMRQNASTPTTGTTFINATSRINTTIPPDVGDIVSNMLRQEATLYRRQDYLTMLLPSKLENGETIDGSWRQRIIEWMYGVVDHCSLRRESVAVATYFLDLAACRDLVKCRKDFQLVAMTSLMLSIKLNDSTMVKLDSMVKLGRGLFNEDDVIEMETKILKVFDWHVHPPTPVCFMRQMLRLLPAETTPVARYIIVEVTRFISEVSACLYKFLKYPASAMAYAAVIIAMERIDEMTLPYWQRQQFWYNVATVTGLDSTSWNVVHAADDLRSSLDNNVNLRDLMRTIDAQCVRANGQMNGKNSKGEPLAGPSSPRDVSVDLY